MNEQIQKLWQQANIRYSVWETLKPRDERKSIPDIFSELIVKECLAQVDKVDAMLEDDKEKIGVAWVGLAITKHFGVEE